MKKVKNLLSTDLLHINVSIFLLGLFGMQEIGYFSGITHGLFPVISNIKSMS
jgi:hypothetical protein